MVKLKAWVSGKMGPYRIITSNFLGKIKSTVAWWWHTLVWSAEQTHFIKYLLKNKDFSVHLLLSCLSWIITFSYMQYKSRSPLPCNELLINDYRVGNSIIGFSIESIVNCDRMIKRVFRSWSIYFKDQREWTDPIDF